MNFLFLSCWTSLFQCLLDSPRSILLSPDYLPAKMTSTRVYRSIMPCSSESAPPISSMATTASEPRNTIINTPSNPSLFLSGNTRLPLLPLFSLFSLTPTTIISRSNNGIKSYSLTGRRDEEVGEMLSLDSVKFQVASTKTKKHVHFSFH